MYFYFVPCLTNLMRQRVNVSWMKHVKKLAWILNLTFAIDASVFNSYSRLMLINANQKLGFYELLTD